MKRTAIALALLGAIDLLRLSMCGTAYKHPHVRSLQSCDQGRPGYQTFTPGPYGMDMLFIEVVTLVAHGRLHVTVI